jgi:alanyl-tRNA synthetase
LKGIINISAEDAFILYSTHGLSPTQIKSLGYTFNDQEFAERMKAHQILSKKGAEQKFKGGLSDHSGQTVKGHTATHLLHQALRDMFGTKLHQTGSNITSERVRFDFNFDRNLTPEELKKIENTINEKIKENLPVHFDMLPLQKAKEIGATGLFNEKYGKTVKVYFVGPETKDQRPYSVELCGGPHVSCTSDIKSFRIIKQENIGKGNRRLYAKVG